MVTPSTVTLVSKALYEAISLNYIPPVEEMSESVVDCKRREPETDAETLTVPLATYTLAATASNSGSVPLRF